MRADTSPVLVIGARSDIARAVARCFAAEGCDIILAARDATSLQSVASDLQIRYSISASLAECDVTNPDADAFFAALPTPPKTIVMAVGLLGDHSESMSDPDAARRVMATNFTGPASYLLAAARLFSTRGIGGCIIAISSVAGERGRASNFIYGASKAGLTQIMSGLRASLAAKQIAVITVKPGFVATRMTAGMALPSRLTAQPAEVAEAIIRARRKGTDVVYVRKVWSPIMWAIRLVPEALFKKLPL